MPNGMNTRRDKNAKPETTYPVDDLVEQGCHLAEMFHREDRVEHLALSFVLFAYARNLTLSVSTLPTEDGENLTENTQ